jgi:hypothetical protein
LQGAKDSLPPVNIVFIRGSQGSPGNVIPNQALGTPELSVKAACLEVFIGFNGEFFSRPMPIRGQGDASSGSKAHPFIIVSISLLAIRKPTHILHV